MQHKSHVPADRERFRERINILRGLAIIGVIAIHTSGHFQQAGGLSPIVTLNIVIDVFSHYAVPLFVLLSGLTLTLRYNADTESLNPIAYYTRRLAKIIPPYIVFSLIYLLLFTIEYEAPPAPAVLFALATGSAYYHLWFVALLVQLYLLFPLARRLLLLHAGGRRTSAILLIALLLQLGWNLGAPVLASHLPARPLVETLLSNRIFLSHIFYFVLGMVAGLHRISFQRRVRSLPTIPVAAAAVLLTALTTVQWLVAIRRHGSFDAVPAGTFTASLAVEPLLFLGTIVLAWQVAACLEPRAGSAVRVLRRLGILSLPIYLVHVLFQRLLAWAFEPLGITPASAIFYLAMFLATLFLSYVAARLFIELPFGEFLTGAPAKRVRN